MVLEHLLPPNWLEKKSLYAFFLGASYAFIGIFLASMLFPADPSLVAIAFTSLLLLPLLRKLFSLHERREKHLRKFNVKNILKDEEGFLKTYLLLIAGIFVMYALAATILPGFETSNFFRDQLELRTGPTGGASFTAGLFFEILINNWWVLVACFLLSLLSGDGAVFILTWNASLWGVIFGVTAKNAALVSNTHPLLYLGLILLIVLPHAFIEMLSYVLGGVAGGLISADIELDPGEEKKDRFKKTFYSAAGAMLVAAIIFLLLGALVETFVLDNVTIYHELIRMSLGLG